MEEGLLLLILLLSWNGTCTIQCRGGKLDTDIIKENDLTNNP